MRNELRMWLYRGLSCVLYAAPLLGLYGFKFDDYSGVGFSIGFFGYVLVMFLVIGFKSKLTDATRKNTVLTVSIIVFVVALIMQWLGQELLIISLCSIGGCALSRIPEPVADYYGAARFRTVKDTNGAERTIRVDNPLVRHKEAWIRAYRGIEVADNG